MAAGLSRWPQDSGRSSSGSHRQDPEALELREQGELAASCRAGGGTHLGDICSCSQPQPADRKLRSEPLHWCAARQGRPPSADVP
jgi:hypothetical protein